MGVVPIKSQSADYQKSEDCASESNLLQYALEFKPTFRQYALKGQKL